MEKRIERVFWGRMISDYFEKKRLSGALSVYSMSIFIGSGLALIVGGTVVDAVVRWKTVTLRCLELSRPGD